MASQGHAFFQKHAPAHTPSWVRTEVLEGDEGQERCFVCDDADTLAYLANLAAIPLHVWSARVATLDRPDWCILDLDPKQAPFTHVVTLALAARKLCTELGLKAYVKSTGSSGLHVLLPLGRQLEHQASVALAQLLSEVLVRRLPRLGHRRPKPACPGRPRLPRRFPEWPGKASRGPLLPRGRSRASPSPCRSAGVR